MRLDARGSPSLLSALVVADLMLNMPHDSETALNFSDSHHLAVAVTPTCGLFTGIYHLPGLFQVSTLSLYFLFTDKKLLSFYSLAALFPFFDQTEASILL